jgi:hypothetical protein
MPNFQRLTHWTSKESVTPFSLNREFDNLTNVLNNVNSGLLSFPTGILVTTPDGLHTYLIGVDNDGAITSTQFS